MQSDSPRRFVIVALPIVKSLITVETKDYGPLMLQYWLLKQVWLLFKDFKITINNRKLLWQ